MPFSDGDIGVGESRIAAIAQIIKDSIAGANAALNRDSYTDYLVSSRFGGDLTDSVVLEGDLDAMWGESEGCLRICVCEGIGAANMNYTASRDYFPATGTDGIKYEYATTIMLYFHPDAFQDDDSDAQIKRQTKALQRMSDWLTFGVFNKRANAVIALTSNIITDPDDEDDPVDLLQMCMVDRCMSGSFLVAYLNIELMGLILTHTGTLR